MKYQKLGNTELKASQVSFGTWGIGGGSVWPDMSVALNEMKDLLDEASDLGINYIDTAPVYGMGNSEELLGNALKDGRRDRFLLQTKCSLNWRENGGNLHYERDGYKVYNNTSKDAIKKDVEDSLIRLKTDVIDILVVHYVCHSWSEEETMLAMQELKQEGKIRAVALSNSKPQDLENYSRYGDVALVQEQFSLLAPYHGYAYFDTTKKYNTTFQAYGLLEEGFLTSRDFVDRQFPKGDVRGKLPWTKEPYRSGIKHLFDVIDSMAQEHHCSASNIIEAWTLLQHPSMNLLTGFRRKETMRDTVKALDIQLTPSEIKILEDAAKPSQVKEIDK